MPVEMKLWQVNGEKLSELGSTALDYERRLQAWICEDPSVLGMDLAVIGREVNTGFGRIDVLAVGRDGEVVIVEIKRDRTPRDVVAQTLEYASWVSDRVYEDLDRIALEYRGKSLRELFAEVFDAPLPNDLSGANHSMLIVSSEFDQASERIVRYLAEKHSLNINGIFFKFFRQDASELLGRAWLMDPVAVQERAETRTRQPWSGYWFVNVGEGEHRNWDDNRRYHYIGAGQGERYSQALRKLGVGDRIFAYMKGQGYVGYGEVVSTAVPVREFTPPGEKRPLLELPLVAAKASENADDPTRSEWIVGVHWMKTLDRSAAQKFPGMFANQNIVCKLRDEATLSTLAREFGVEGVS